MRPAPRPRRQHTVDMDSAGDRLRREFRLAHGHPDPGRCPTGSPHLHRARRQGHRDRAEREDRARRGGSLHGHGHPDEPRPPNTATHADRDRVPAPTPSRSCPTGQKPPYVRQSRPCRARSPPSTPPPTPQALPSRPGAPPTPSRSRRTGRPPTSPISVRAPSTPIRTATNAAGHSIATGLESRSPSRSRRTGRPPTSPTIRARARVTPIHTADQHGGPPP